MSGGSAVSDSGGNLAAQFQPDVPCGEDARKVGQHFLIRDDESVRRKSKIHRDKFSRLH